MSKPDATLVGEVERVREARILFSHHSVGADMLAGLVQLGAGRLHPISLDAAKRQGGPALIDVSGGENGAPKSKIDFFAATLRGLRISEPRIALMKLCFVDFDPHTDVDELFAYYRTTLLELERELPNVTFAHATVPLVVRPRDMKSRVYRLVGRTVWEDAANVKRGEFNQRLLEGFATAPIFDLARAQSTRADGSRELFMFAGRQHPSLDPAYSSDGGHLNELGKRVIGEQFLRFLGRLAR